MKNKMKKVLGIILSLVLVLGLMPWTSLTAYAVDTDLTLDDLVRAVGNRTVFRTSSSGTYISVLSGVLRLDYADPNNNGQYQTYNAASLTYDSSEGKYYVAFNGWTPTYYLVLDNDNYITSFVGTDSEGNTITFTGKSTNPFEKSVTNYTVTYKVVNGTWDGTSTADKTETVASGGKPARVPTGMEANSGYTGGSWDTDPSTATISADTTFTYTFTEQQSISQTVTFKVVNGSWDDGTTADKIVTLTGNEGDTLKLTTEQIPAVGTKPNDGYKAGSWDVTPSTDTAISSNVTYTYTYVADSSGGSSDSGNTSGGTSSGSSDNTNTNTDTSAKVPYDDVAISTGSVNDITGTAAATAESNPFGTKIENNSNLTTLLSLTDAEVAQGVNVWLDIQDMSASVSKTDKSLIQDKSGDYTVGLYLDINLFKKVGGNDATKVTETNGKVKASIVIPESLWKSGRTFEIIRVHDGVATAIAGTYDENTHVFTFETDKFSTYALAYKDPASSSNSGTTSNSSSSNSSNSTQSTAPKTGDPNDIRVWYLLLIASFGGLGFLGLSKKKEN
ncbi:hypothetical protein SAMN04487831_102155 [Pseudobutyrivibrio sp. UC1225]|uniref:hypothetical protein n=1 Tax=Pseudobutyrivibrio sp. UC1225 TaxID=1798185 RepID=UPI0008E30C10|nr:hypothetical protein [Pseudobutyrivibrio sp. UC1225]SFN61408.1 hypothetical protein SAMN04487831_102155 [Pseudobutyrivibrio sp. UC1225]